MPRQKRERHARRKALPQRNPGRIIEAAGIEAVEEEVVVGDVDLAEAMAGEEGEEEAEEQ